jgi:hypothetical protein
MDPDLTILVLMLFLFTKLNLSKYLKIYKKENNGIISDKIEFRALTLGD